MQKMGGLTRDTQKQRIARKGGGCGHKGGEARTEDRLSMSGEEGAGTGELKDWDRRTDDANLDASLNLADVLALVSHSSTWGVSFLQAKSAVWVSPTPFDGMCK